MFYASRLSHRIWNLQFQGCTSAWMLIKNCCSVYRWHHYHYHETIINFEHDIDNSIASQCFFECMNFIKRLQFGPKTMNRKRKKEKLPAIRAIGSTLITVCVFFLFTPQNWSQSSYCTYNNYTFHCLLIKT